jgi:hypothetical protein
MLLETLDLRNDDILVYSQNRFNFNDNFKIIYKNQKNKRPHKISYFEVCNYVKSPSPKNLIIYRLLTNINQLDAFSTKYGYFIKINGKMELIYFDPVFAIKDLRHLRLDFDPSKFRFKIQQIGLTSLTKRENEPSFAEVYSFDLKAVEAQHQNDKIFADAIFAFDPDYSDDEILEPFETDLDKSNEVKKLIVEDKSAILSELNAVKADDSINAIELREEIVRLLKYALGIEEMKSATEKKSAKSEEIASTFPDQTNLNLFDLFKTTQKLDEISSRGKETVILKFE